MVKQPVIHITTSINSRCPMSGLMDVVRFTKAEARKSCEFYKWSVDIGSVGQGMGRCVSVFITLMNILFHRSLQNQFSESVTVCDMTRVCSPCFLMCYRRYRELQFIQYIDL